MSQANTNRGQWGRQLRRLLAWGAVLWLITVATLLVAEHWFDRFRLNWPVRIYFGLTLFFSLVAAIAYGLDKWKATRNAWRIPEFWLQTFALCGGWPGAVLAQQLFRHKTQKISFRIVLTAIILLHASLILWYGINLLNTA